MPSNLILFPTDFSHNGDSALGIATSLAREAGAKLLIVHVIEPEAAYASGEFYYGVPNPPTDELWRMLREVRPAVSTVRCEHRLLSGTPAAAIVELAGKENVDLIVMSTHGRTGLKRLLMGSVAEAVVRNATCPVMTFKQSAAGLSKAKSSKPS